MSEILQGTTPTICFIVSEEDFSVEDMTALELVFRSGATTLYKSLEDVALDSEENTFSYSFSEAETLMFDPRKRLRYQWRAVLQGGSIVGIRAADVGVADLMSEERLL